MLCNSHNLNLSSLKLCLRFKFSETLSLCSSLFHRRIHSARLSFRDPFTLLVSLSETHSLCSSLFHRRIHSARLSFRDPFTLLVSLSQTHSQNRRYAAFLLLMCGFSPHSHVKTQPYVSKLTRSEHSHGCPSLICNNILTIFLVLVKVILVL